MTGAGQAPRRLVLVTAQAPQDLSAAELVEIYLQYRLAGANLSGVRTAQLERTLRGFADVVGPTPVDAEAVKRWVASRDGVTPKTRYDEFCVVRTCCTWLGERRYITPIQWGSSEWPRSLRSRGHRAALQQARANEEDFEEYLYGIGLCERTVVEYVRELVRARRWFAENGQDLASAPPSVVGAYANTRAPSWSSRKIVRSTLSHYWTMTGRPRPPVGAIRVPPKPRGRYRGLNRDDSVILAEAARSRGDDPGLAVALILYAGLRRREVAELRWECFDADFAWVTIHGKLDIEATIPVHPRLRALLLAKGRGTGWVFPGRFPDRPSTPHRIYHWVRKVADEAGVSDMTPHRGRHVAIATVNDNTGNLRAAQDFARQSDPRVTAIYTRTTEKRLQNAVDAIDY